MLELYEYEIWHTSDRPLYQNQVVDRDGQPIAPGWYYWFEHESYPVGPFTTSDRAETAAEAELEEMLYAN